MCFFLRKPNILNLPNIDYPAQIRKACQVLKPEGCRAHKDNKEVVIAYLAKLGINKKVARDKFPDQHAVLGGDTEQWMKLAVNHCMSLNLSCC